MAVQQISVFELQTKLQQKESLVILDVRESFEFEHARIEGSVLIPINQIPDRLDELDKQANIVALCHHGVRSQYAADFLVQSGFSKVANLQGGIDAWSLQCDASIPRY